MYLGETPAAQQTSPAWLDKMMDIGKGALALKQQSDIQKINTERLKQGLKPIEASDVAVGAKVAFDEKQLNKILLASAAGLGLLLAFLVISRERRGG